MCDLHGGFASGPQRQKSKNIAVQAAFLENMSSRPSSNTAAHTPLKLYPMGSDAPFQPLHALHTCGAQTYMQGKHPCT